MKIRFADMYYVAKRLILVECGDVLKNPVMPVRLPQIWIDFHFTAYFSPSVESPATLFIHSNDNVPSSLTSSPKSVFFRSLCSSKLHVCHLTKLAASQTGNVPRGRRGEAFQYHNTLGEGGAFFTNQNLLSHLNFV